MVVYRYWGQIKGVVTGFIDGFLAAVAPFTQTVGEIWGALGNLWREIDKVFGVSEWLGKAWSWVCDTAAWLGRELFALGKSVTDFLGISEWLGKVWNWVCDVAKSLWGWITSLFKPIEDNSAAVNEATEKGKEMGKAFGEFIIEKLKQFKKFIEDLIPKVEGFKEKMVNAFRGIKEFCTPILDALSAGLFALSHNFGSLDRTLNTLSFGWFGESDEEREKRMGARLKEIEARENERDQERWAHVYRAQEEARVKAAALRKDLQPVNQSNKANVNNNYNPTIIINEAKSPRETQKAVASVFYDMSRSRDNGDSMFDDFEPTYAV